MTASQLFADYNPRGDFNCFYCGGTCNNENTVKKYVKPAFTGYSRVVCPGSEYVCQGCVSSFSESTIIRLPEEERESQRVRLYSWVIDSQGAKPYTKKHIEILRDVVLNPPPPPYVIALANSGQKHIIYLSKVNYSREYIYVNLEEETIGFTKKDFMGRLEIVTKIIAALGKIQILEPIDFRFVKELSEYWGDEAAGMINHFESIQNDSLTRLAVWLAPNKELASEKYGNRINPGVIPAKISGDRAKEPQLELF